MIFTWRNQLTGLVDEYGALWFEIDEGPDYCTGLKTMHGRQWLRWCGIDF